LPVKPSSSIYVISRDPVRLMELTIAAGKLVLLRPSLSWERPGCAVAQAVSIGKNTGTRRQLGPAIPEK